MLLREDKVKNKFMDIPGLNKVGDAIGNAFSVFDFSFFVSGTVTIGFIVLDMHYYGHDGILQLDGWKSVVGWLLAIYVCGLMSWSTGKWIRWAILGILWHKKGGVRGDFNRFFAETVRKCKPNQENCAANIISANDISYTEMWLYIDMEESLKGKMSFLNKMWVMVAVYEGLVFSWIVGLIVYLDGCLIGKWISLNPKWCFVVPIIILLILFVSSCWRATSYSRELIKEVIVTYYKYKYE